MSFQRAFLIQTRNLSGIAKYGRGGRSSNSGLTVTVFGSTGFVSKYLMSELGACGTRVYAPFRGDELEVRHLKPMFDLGQLGLIPFHARDKDSIRETVKHSDVVVNLIGKSYETQHLIPTRRSNGKLSRTNFTFEETHVEVARNIAEVAKECGVSKFIHVSATAANANSNSRWSRSKAQGEIAVRDVIEDAIVVRLNTVFGPEDRFLNLIAEASKRLPFFPLINEGQNIVQPVYVADVGKGLHSLVQNYDEYRGSTFDFSGPSEYTYKEIAEFVQDVTLLQKRLVDVPVSFASTAGLIAENWLNPFFSEDAVARILEDVVPAENTRKITELGIELGSLDRLAFDYLHRFRKGGHFTLAKGYH
jgi:NADH dehydrogenase (ubiquinone) 1 alpha subcomplex subunit 9